MNVYDVAINRMEKFVISVVFLLMMTNVLVSADWDDDVVPLWENMALDGKHSSLSVLFVTVEF